MQLRTAAALLATLSVSRSLPHTHGEEAGERARERERRQTASHPPSLPPRERASPTHGKEGNPQRRLASQTAVRKAGRARRPPCPSVLSLPNPKPVLLARCIFSRCSGGGGGRSGGGGVFCAASGAAAAAVAAAAVAAAKACLPRRRRRSRDGRFQPDLAAAAKMQRGREIERESGKGETDRRDAT